MDLLRRFGWGRTRVSALLPASDRKRIGEAVSAAERGTSGEIRVKVIVRCDRNLRKQEPVAGRVHQQAIREFHREGVHNTRDKVGVLLLVVVADRRLEILADTGICAKLSQTFWDERIQRLSDRFKGGRYADGICEVVADVGEQLKKHFPKQDDDLNELPDEPVIEE